MRNIPGVVISVRRERPCPGLRTHCGSETINQAVALFVSDMNIRPRGLSGNSRLCDFYVLDEGMPREKVSAYLGRWFVMTVLTSRYTGSPESRMDRDLRMIEEKGFEQYLMEVEDSELSDSFWESKLVQNLETSRYSNPYFYTYLAAQIFFHDSSLLTINTKVETIARIDVGNVHHIFPKAYLERNGYKPVKYNQVANYAYIPNPINLSISDKPPAKYFGMVRDQCSSKDVKIGDITDESILMSNLEVNCIPEDIFNMDHARYEEFLLKRRRLMAERIRRYYEAIKLRC